MVIKLDDLCKPPWGYEVILLEKADIIILVYIINIVISKILFMRPFYHKRYIQT
jgi:hypothetical protein